MLIAMDINEAMDIVDEWGSDAELWPDEHRAELKRMFAEDEDFRDYVETAQKIDAMLDDWKMDDDDGAQIQLDEDDLDDNDEPDDMSDEPDMDGEEGDEPSEQTSRPEADSIHEINIEDIESGTSDMDEVLQNIILTQIAGEDQDQFNVFTRDYDVMPDIEVPAHTPIDAIDQHVSKSVGPLMKDLRRLIAAKSQAKKLPGMRRGKLHGPNLHRIMTGDDRVFFRREIAPSLDTAITMVLDCSGSMSGSRMALAAQTAYALGTVLNKLGIAFECLGFTTAEGKHQHPDVRTRQYMDEITEANAIRPVHRHLPIVMPKFKGFEERWLPQVQRRFAHVHNCHGQEFAPNIEWGGTPEGCGNEFAARRLLRRKEARKIMITMTDGEPMAPLFNWNVDQQLYSARMVKMIEAAGIDLVGIGIQHNGPKRYYSNAMVINKIDEMPVQLLALLKKLLIGK